MPVVAAPLHPVRQLMWHLRSHQPLTPPAWLSAAEAKLFARMAPADQREGQAVVEELREAGWGEDRNLLVAGLLHDAGKCLAPPSAGYRVAMTLIESLAPALLPVIAQRSGAIEALANHARAGARMAAAAGLPEDVQGLIAEHHAPARDARMAALQRADGLH